MTTNNEASNSVPALENASPEIAAGDPAENLSPEERGAIRDRVRELRPKRPSKGSAAADDLQAVLDRINSMTPSDREIALFLHAIITTTAPQLAARTWYGMPAYALNGKVICFFQDAGKFKTRYATIGFSDGANLDDGDLWPSAYAIASVNPGVEERITTLIRRAVGN